MMGGLLWVVVKGINRATFTVLSTRFHSHTWINLVEILSKVLLSLDLVVMNEPCFRSFLFSHDSSMTVRSIFLQLFDHLLRWVSTKFCIAFDWRIVTFWHLIFFSLLENDGLITEWPEALVERSTISSVKGTKSFRTTFTNESTCHDLFLKWTALLFGSSSIDGRLLCPEPFIAFGRDLSQTTCFKSLSST